MSIRNTFSRFVNFDSVVFVSLLTASAITLKNAYDIGRFPLLNSVDSGHRQYNLDKYITPKVVKGLEENGFVIINDVLSKEELLSISKDLIELNNSQLELEDSPNRDDTVRTDKLCFMIKEHRDEVIKRRRPLLSSSSSAEIRNNHDGGAGEVGCCSSVSGVVSGGSLSLSIVDLHASGESLLHGQNILLGLGNSLLKCGFTGFNNPSTKSKESKTIISSLFVPDQVMLSLYSPSGSFYKRHLDAVSPSMFYSMGFVEWLKSYCYRVRVLSAILYLNSGEPWNGNEKNDGGCLRIYLNKDQESASRRYDDSMINEVATNNEFYPIKKSNKDKGKEAYIDIAPEGGRLVIFDSQTIFHEVLPSNRKRHAISVWLTCSN
jgi:hypothetical protein